MAERKSLANALTMSKEKLAFIQGGGLHLDALSVVEPSGEAASSTLPDDDRTASRQIPAIDPPQDGETPRPRRRLPANQAIRPGELLSEIMVPLTTRLHHRTADALRRASLEQRLRRATPDKVQEIVETAVQTWLTDHGFLESGE